jgi:hypothetical protein
LLLYGLRHFQEPRRQKFAPSLAIPSDSNLVTSLNVALAAGDPAAVVDVLVAVMGRLLVSPISTFPIGARGFHQMSQKGVAKHHRNKRPVEQQQRLETKCFAYHHVWDDAADRHDQEQAGSALQKRYPCCSYDVNYQSLRQQIFNEPPGLKQRWFCPRCETREVETSDTVHLS